MSRQHKGVADFDRIIPEYFQSLDKKMKYLSEQGFVPLLESVRRDNCPAWKAYFDFNEYIRGIFNILFQDMELIIFFSAEFTLIGFPENIVLQLMNSTKH